ncbi:type VI secretion system baseplate subunit TssE [Parachitinimonas caeni]|uniref:Type VI secretion system baseplate subunit TssE n=1 Tax=Parachitinimonas caeni TaxID=3031301 RepID=A0ABT7E2L8_9NEIS|nr:type VI secretion system baseplate subunit TssE [Parachitinimonas caeni]MDK2126557.1 type VI secretion system baseplate subunit TssE [Parachitinimonas caeni]
MSIDVFPLERLQPTLLDRLTDEEPDKVEEAPESRTVAKSQYRKAVLRDLGWLLNATQLVSQRDLVGLDEVAHSVVNYGLPPLSGRNLSQLDPRSLERSIRDSILCFEPRILAESLVVTMLEYDVLSSHNLIGFEIRGVLWAQPYPIELLLKTQLDLERGEFRVVDA